MLGKGLLKERKIRTMPVVIENEYVEINAKRRCLPRREENGTVGAVASNVAGTTCSVIGNVGTKETRGRKLKVKYVSEESLATRTMEKDSYRPWIPEIWNQDKRSA
jgi:hypothetical protein